MEFLEKLDAETLKEELLSFLEDGEEIVELTSLGEFEEQLEKDMDAGENPDTLYEAPGNISEDTQDEGEQKYLKYLHAVMDEEAVMELTEN